MREITGSTGLCCLIGDPVKHSISPQMHNAAFSSLNLNLVYLAFQVKKECLKAAVNAIRAFEIRGVNVTVPHKIEVMPLLDEIDNAARKIKAVNVILNRGGKLIGFNTDGKGALKSVGKERIRNKNVVIIGAGGAARAIAFVFAEEGKSLTILNRTTQKAVDLAREVEENSKARASGLGLSGGNVGEALRECDLLVNATTVGMYPHVEETVIGKAHLKEGMTVFDTVFNPLETRLLKDARSRGAEAIGGLDMLVHQGAEAFHIWTGVQPPIDLMRKAALEALRDPRMNTYERSS